MAVNQQRKKAMKRLAFDQEELLRSPVDGVSAAPLDENMMEWHCNFEFDDVIYHVILFFPETYPYYSPSAEFVPSGFQFVGGATKQGKKGTQVCLSIFSDFAEWHREWADEKGMGWSPGYTVQTVMINFVAFMADMQSQMGEWGKATFKNNEKLAQNFTCKDCGHTGKKPYPPMPDMSSKSVKAGAAKAAKEDEATKFQIVDYISKTKFSIGKPKGKEDLYGYGLIKSGPDHRPSLTTPCEFLNGYSFYGMKKSIGKVQSIMKEELAFFLPLYIHPQHGEQIQDTIEETMRDVAAILPGCKNFGKKNQADEVIMRVIPNLMSATVVEFSKGTQHASNNHLGGYFSLHRLFLWAIKKYPGLQKKIDDKLTNFIENEEMRSKNKCPHIGEWLMLLSGSSKYRWQDAADAYLSESWKRNVMWYVKDDAKLGFLDTDKQYRLEHTLQATAVSRKLLAFQVLFLDIAMPSEMSREQIIKRYDDNCGFPTDKMVTEMKAACAKIENMKTYDDWFKVLKLPTPSDDEIFKRLLKAVEFSINTHGYKWTFFKNQGGWSAVLRKYPKGTPGWDPSKKDDDGEATPKGKGKGKGKSSAKKTEEEPMEVDEPEKGKGRGKKRKGDDEEEAAPKGKGRGRGAKTAKFEESEKESEDDEDETPKGKGRGRGRGRGGGRGKAAASPAVGRGRKDRK